MENIRQAPIGVFDSGVGGLTVAREIIRQLPDERVIYFGDTARVPYGSKSRDTVIRYSRQIIRFRSLYSSINSALPVRQFVVVRRHLVGDLTYDRKSNG